MPDKKNNKNEITCQQKAVIESGADVKRVIACAGSGKTFVLTCSIIELLQKQACRPGEILAITFTRNAAENMRLNIRNKIGSDIDFEALNIYTFNSFGNLILSENSFSLGLGKDYRLINSSKSWQILFEIIKYTDLKNITVGRDAGRFVEQVLEYINSLKSNLISVEELDHYYENRETILSSFLSKALKREEEEICKYLKDITVIYRKYEEAKLQNNFVDYNDHVFLPYRMLKDNKKLLEKYRNRYKYIFIDEFQDTDIAQGFLISLLYKPAYNKLMIVGDDDQGIYSFRGACVENILNFSNWDVFSDARVEDFYLTTNFRSGKKIIHTLNNVISQNEYRFVKDFKPYDNAGHSEVMFFSEATHIEEAYEIAENIKSLLHQGLKSGDIAILSRKKRFGCICEALEKNGLKYELISGRGFFFEPEILFIISWLMVLKNIYDEVYLVHLLQSGRYKISDRDIFFLTYSSKDDRRVRLADGVFDYKNNDFLSPAAKERIGEFIDELDYYIKQASYLRLGELIALIFNHSGLFDELKSDFDLNTRTRIRNIETMIKISSDFESDGLANSLESFIIYLKDIAKVEDEDPESVDFSQSNSIKIMSIHAAKGLEFEAVFLPMLWKADYIGRSRSARFRIPYLLRKDREIYKKKNSFTSRKSFDDEIRKLNIEEERRIFYVACSRARSKLFLSYSSFEHPGELSKPDKKAKEILPFLLDIFRGENIIAMNKKSLEFIKSVNGGDSGIKLYKKNEAGQNRKSKNLKKSGIDAGGLEGRAVFNQEAAYRAENLLLSIMKKTGKKAVQNKSGCYTTVSEKSSSEPLHLPKIHFSLTELLDYMECPVHYRWKYFYNFPEAASENIKTGERVHEQIRAITAIKFNGVIEGEFTGSGDFKYAAGSYRKKEEKISVSRYIENYMKSSFYETGDLKQMFLEQLFYWNVYGCIITCKVDRLDITEDGSIRIIDYKISKAGKNGPEKKYIRQLKAYTAGVADIFRTSVDDITGHLLFLGDKSEHKLSFTIYQLEEFRSELKDSIEKINNLDFSSGKDKCNNKKCTFYIMCRSDGIRL